jgi:hypothetical protein
MVKLQELYAKEEDEICGFNCRECVCCGIMARDVVQSCRVANVFRRNVSPPFSMCASTKLHNV